jgi:hypothetical protein
MPRFECPHPNCGKSYSQRGHLTVHQRSAHQGQRYECPHANCGKRYTQPGHLALHERSAHQGEWCKCPHPGCAKAYTQRSHLALHERTTHQGERHECSYPNCSKTYTNRSNLATHERTAHQLPEQHSGHEREETYFCYEEGAAGAFCGEGAPLGFGYAPPAAFGELCVESAVPAQPERSALPGERFGCPHLGCTKSYTNRGNLATHERSAHQGERYECPHEGCGKSYTRRGHLAKHLSTANHWTGMSEQDREDQDREEMLDTAAALLALPVASRVSA